MKISNNNQQYQLTPVAIAHTPFNEKFGIPRQSGLVDVPAQIELLAPFNRAEAVAGLEQVSHIWLSFVFDRHAVDQSSPDFSPRLSVRPPRLGGNKKIGVFACRSSFRPNGLGQSLVKLQDVDIVGSSIVLHVSGLDLLDRTPIFDIKPYLPYAESVADAINHIAGDKPEPSLVVHWSDDSTRQLMHYFAAQHAQIKGLVTELIALDPRPAYKQGQVKGDYVMTYAAIDFCWRMLAEDVVEVTQLKPWLEA